ncbi:MAG: Do family serine endopeptidase [Candidatus Omnitrophica bacterium]|nr:Do family serine endopeptidase [Candidatus Omnitrophota bacterium]
MKKILFFLIFIFCFTNTFAQKYSDLENATISVAETVGKAVVSISSVVKVRVGGGWYFGYPFDEFENDPFRRFFEEFFGEIPYREYKHVGLGSGVIIDPDGYILTNEHVIVGASQIKVKLADGREFDAEIKGTDPTTDLAIIKINAYHLPYAKLGDSDNLKIGEWVVAIGNPFGFAIDNPEPTVTVGVISALHRDIPALARIGRRAYSDLIQTDAAINPGNSGGPLVNLNGEVIGINTAIITTTGGYQGVGFAIPINKAKQILDKLIRGEKVLYGWLGIGIQDLNEELRSYFGTKEKEGVIIVKVEENSPAKKANLKEGDLILSFNNKIISNKRDLEKIVSSLQIGKTYPIQILRDGKQLFLDIEVAPRPYEDSYFETAKIKKEIIFRGMKVKDIDLFLKQKYNIKENEGVVITNIQENSAAEKSGFMVGDVILKIENKIIKNTNDFFEITSKIKGKCLVRTNRGFIILKEE